MKKILALILAIFIVFVSCQKNKPLFSNMSGDESLEEVKTALNANLDSKNAETFIKGVIDYNETIERTGLTKGFEEKQPEYDEQKIEELWSSKKGDFIGTNCRINTFMLLKDNIEIKKSSIDDSLLFLDKDAIALGHIFNDDDTERFKQLFSRVKTENTKDISTHAQKMKEHFKNISFDKNAKMLSVVLHDNLDGDYLFIGHAGVLLENKGALLFIEKLSFSEPYQAVKFAQKEDCYNYLFLKYKHYHDETTAKPFIMENDELVELELYKE
ncbi:MULTISPECIES: DUF4300 family protein [unclassified Treponema]|uniref:DUF4300 family protein n=1 Tax=unclassified Treponema TaxID=2638727 RepID=UPI0020A40B1E|nr:MULTISPECIES: DUF4300 family protein [unclassified Treponema]UTC67112.1 DUF4300 family protein [Treponema sp. OMZ 789]UTC69843.1 DUF4300 family protein [Treponema sp. OMZ 790]UTC72557.1 DUF4300 family protein [Treponema sp. OMZ 791]